MTQRDFEDKFSDPDMTDSLYALKYVLNVPKGKGETGLIKVYRTILKDNPAKIAEMHSKEDAAYAATKKGLPIPGAEVVDVGTDKAVELCVKLLKELREKKEAKP